MKERARTRERARARARESQRAKEREQESESKREPESERARAREREQEREREKERGKTDRLAVTKRCPFFHPVDAHPTAIVSKDQKLSFVRAMLKQANDKNGRVIRTESVALARQQARTRVRGEPCRGCTTSARLRGVVCNNSEVR